MPNLLQKDPPSIQENLVKSLKALNDTGHLTYLINTLNERKISSAAEAFTLISLCIYCYPKIINHPERQNLEKLYDECFLKANPEDLFKVLDRPHNSAVKDLLYDYFKRVADKYKSQNKKKTPVPAKHLLDNYVQFVAENYPPQNRKTPPALVKYLLDDYMQFTGNNRTQKIDKTPPRNR